MSETIQLFVGNLPLDVTAEELKADFASMGTIHEAVILTHKDSGKSRGFGFITIEAQDKSNFLALDGAEYGKRYITVAPKKQRQVIARSRKEA